MPAFLMQLVNSIKAVWAKMSVMQRVAVMGGFVLVSSAAIGLSIWASRPDYKVLYSNLSAEDASVVIKSLQADKVLYQLTDNGKTILVPKEVVYDERIKIAGEGGLVGQGIGFEIFDKVKVGQTDFVQKINYTRALQGELSRTISEFPNVESARVHLVIPHRSLFVEERQSPSASVVLKLKRPNVKPDQKEINAILNMMLMAVEGLDKTHVSISDNGGKVLYQPESDSLPVQAPPRWNTASRCSATLNAALKKCCSPCLALAELSPRSTWIWISASAPSAANCLTTKKPQYAASSAVKKPSRAARILKAARRTPTFVVMA